MLAGVVRRETLLCSLIGGVLGIAAASVLVFPFSAFIEIRLQLPYLMPPAWMIFLISAGVLAGVLLAGMLASAWAVRRLGRADPGTVLREGN